MDEGSPFWEVLWNILSLSTLGGAQEICNMAALLPFDCHGMIFVPMGYLEPKVFPHDEVHGATLYGSGTSAGW